MRARFVFLLVALLAGSAAPVRAQITAELAFRDAPRNGEWELFVVHFQTPSGGGMLSVQDSRGGFTVRRPVDSAAVDPASSQAQLLIPLPFIAEADLPLDRWPVEISVRGVSGEVERQHVEVERLAASAAPAALRIARTDMVGTLPQIGARSPAFITVSDEEILSGPVLTFAACDAVLLSDRVARRLSAERLAALLNTGVQLISARDPATGGGVLSHLAWTPMSAAADAPRFWISVRNSYPRPRVLEPGLDRVNALWESAGPSRRTTWTVVLIPAASLVLLFLARGLFRRRFLVVLTMLFALAGLSVAVIFYLRSSESARTTCIAWVAGDAPQPMGGTTLKITDSFIATSALFGEQARITAEQDQLLFPASASARQHFARRNTILSLDLPSEDGLRRISRLEVPLGPRKILLYSLRFAALRAEDPKARQPSVGDWIEGGYVTPASAKGSPATAATPTLVTRWAAENPTISDALNAWYELRFVASHRYFMQIPSGDDPLALTDFGPSDSLTPPP